MPELRWTLLLLGALFIAVLAWSERRKSRHQSARSAHEPTISDTPPPTRVHREPPVAHELPLPEIRARDPSPPQELPVVQVDDETLTGLRIDGRHPERELAEEETLLSTPEEVVADLPVLEVAEEAEIEAEIDEDRTVAMSASAAESAPGASNASPGPSVDWPPEEDRRIIALRLVSVSPERFSGRAIRTALVAEGFVLGKFSIFHKPDAHNRALLSAASLSKPGMFDLETIDTQRFSGLNLFAVVSGTQPAREMFEQLLSCARNLNERLEGGLQDDRGGPLTPSRIAALRESLGATP